MIVSPGVKVIAWILVVMVNFFFVFFSILRGLERGADWQRMFLMACIFRKFGHLPHLSPLPLVPPPLPSLSSLAELIVEIFFYETTECVIVHYIIPGTPPSLS
jgi:hypothetical protein